MLKIYSNKNCPDCIACKKNLDYYQIPYEEIDVLDSLYNLKTFLILRDKLEVFNHCKEIHDIGLPALVLDNGDITLDWEGYLLKEGKEIIFKIEGASCSLDGKGC